MLRDPARGQALLERYERWAFVALAPGLLLTAWMTYARLSIVKMYELPCGVAAVAAAITLNVVVAFRYRQLTGRFPWVKRYWTAAAWSVAAAVFLAVSLVSVTNCELDRSVSVERGTAVTRLWIIHAKFFTVYYIDVASWNADPTGIAVIVSKDQYRELRVGERVTIVSREGLWGLEHVRLSTK